MYGLEWQQAKFKDTPAQTADLIACLGVKLGIKIRIIAIFASFFCLKDDFFDKSF